MRYLICLALLTTCLFSCQDDDDNSETLAIDLPECVETTIENDTERSFNRVLEFNIDGDIYYDFDNTECCDRGGFVLDVNCDTVCTIIGFTGARVGDNCPDYNSSSLTTRLIWER